MRVCVSGALLLSLSLSLSRALSFFPSGCKPFELPLLSGGLIYGYPDANYNFRLAVVVGSSQPCNGFDFETLTNGFNGQGVSLI